MRLRKIPRYRMALYALLVLIVAAALVEIAVRIEYPGRFDFTADEKYWNLWEHSNLYHQFDNVADISVNGAVVSPNKPAGVARIFCLGSSSTYGAGLADRSRTFCGELQKLLPETQVINAGYGGYNSYQLYVFLDEVLMKLQPDLIVFYYGGNEGYGNSAKKFYPNAKKIVDQAVSQGRTNMYDFERCVFYNSTNPAVHLAYRLLERSKAFLWWRNRVIDARYQTELLDAALRNKVDYPPSSQQILADMAALAERNRFGLLLIPEMSSLGAYANKMYWEFMQEQCKDGRTVCLDAKPILDNNANPGLFIDTSHLTEAGHRRFAEALVPEIRRMLDAP